MDGKDILEKVCNAYANFDTYADVGTVESPGLPGPGIEFQTYFRRPLNFRFQWLSWHPYFGKTKPADEHAVWTDGSTFRSHYHGEIQERQSFSMMIAGATGISSGAVHNILNILVSGAVELSHNWHEMTDVRLLDEKIVDDVPCLHIIGTINNSDDCELWLEKDKYLVRRLKETIVITESMSAAMREEQQRPDRLEMMRTMAKKAGLSDKQIAETIAHLVTAGFQPMTYSHIYNYTTVTVNETIEHGLFTN